MLRLKVLKLLAVLLLAPSAMAGTSNILACTLAMTLGLSSPAQVLKAHAVEVIEKLQQDGPQVIYGISLEKLKAEILNDVQWIDDANVQLPEEYETRRSAGCDIGGKKVFVKTPLSGEDLPLLALHEGMCAIGLFDVDYDISATFAMLSKLEPAARARFIHETRGFSGITGARVAGTKGGISGVSGGGDLTAARIKAEVLFKLVTERAMGASGFLPFSHTQLEPSVTNEFKFDLTAARGSNWYADLRFWLPISEWENFPQSRAKLVDRIAAIFASVYDLNYDAKMEVVAECAERVARIDKPIPSRFYMPMHRASEVEVLVPKLVRDYNDECQKIKKR